MIWRIEIKEKPGVFDAVGEGVKKDIADLGLTSVSDVRVTHVYTVEGDLSEDDVRTISRRLLSDPVTQEYIYSEFDKRAKASQGRGGRVIEIAYNPGVMDPVEASTLKGIRDFGINGVAAVRTSRQYCLSGNIQDGDVDLIVDKVLANKLIQQVVRNGYHPFTAIQAQEKFDLITVDLLKAGPRRLDEIAAKGQLFLNTNEMRAIQKHFKKLGRNPTDCELETFAQTWSEHCYHKTFRSDIRYAEPGGTKTIRNLFKSTIVKATETVKRPWCVSVFHDNAGVIKFDEGHHVCFKVETHNHPSALEPFGGANTGIGGVVRDILGTGLGAKPIANTDIFCFAPPDFPREKLPPGTLHPKRVMKGVVSGVRDYGNKMGIPTVNGTIQFDERFVGNPLVYCGNVGLIPKGMEKKKAGRGDLIVVAGGKTGRDGIHGATFSSGELTEESETISSGAVQIGNPIEEKKVLDALLQARDAGLYSAITDCGAGGLSSAVGEMGEALGARVDLDKVPLKYQGLSYTEIWISESQERMVMSVPPENRDRLLKIFQDENVEATVIGSFTGSKRLELFYRGCQVCDLEMKALHGGIPKTVKKARWSRPKVQDPKFPCPEDLTESLKKILSDYNVCSKEWVIRQYDHEVQGSSVIKPLCGIGCDGPSDAAVIAPKLGSTKGLSVSNGINVRFGQIDPYWMAASCIDEAIRQIVAVGGDPARIALLDNFCWGNPDKPDRLGSLVRCCLGCSKIAIAYGTPFISGKDSLYNEYTVGNQSIAIPGTILISAIGIIDDVTRCVTMDFKEAGNGIYLVGRTYDELGGSVYYAAHGALGRAVPEVRPVQGKKVFAGLYAAVRKGLVRSMHDCSEGGLGAAVAEMAFSGGLGAEISLKDVPYSGKAKRNDHVLFSESNSRLVVEVEPGKEKNFEKLLSRSGVQWGRIGRVADSSRLLVSGLDGRTCLEADIADLKRVWQKPLAF